MKLLKTTGYELDVVEGAQEHQRVGLEISEDLSLGLTSIPLDLRYVVWEDAVNNVYLASIGISTVQHYLPDIDAVTLSRLTKWFKIYYYDRVRNIDYSGVEELLAKEIKPGRYELGIPGLMLLLMYAIMLAAENYDKAMEIIYDGDVAHLTQRLDLFQVDAGYNGSRENLRQRLADSTPLRRYTEDLKREDYVQIITDIMSVIINKLI